jgi:DNA polymerase/3'-5' exonuclease PolX
MSATAQRLPRAEAEAIAARFIGRLDGSYERLAIAGSIRRRTRTCGDIELVVVPRVETVEDRTPGLFEDAVTPRQVDRLHECLEQLLAEGVVSKRLLSDGATRWGPGLKYLTFEGAPVDLFCPDADRFGWMMAIRTGPAELSRQLVVPRDRRTKDGRLGLLPKHIVVNKGLCYRMSRERIPTPDEADVWRALGIQEREPWLRH